MTIIGLLFKLPRWYDVAKKGHRFDSAILRVHGTGIFLLCALVWTRGRSLASATALQHPLFSCTYCTRGGGESSIASCGVRGCWVVRSVWLAR